MFITFKLPAKNSLLRRLFIFMIVRQYTNHQSRLIIQFKCADKAKNANKRFEDRIDQYVVFSVLELYKFKCFFCNDTLRGKTWQLDHFYSRAMSGKNVVSNLCPTCKWCNQMKHALDGHSFIDKCKKIAANNFFITNLLTENLTEAV